MKNKIVAMALAFITVIACCAFTTAAEETPILMPVVEEKVEIEPAFMIERIKEFNDPNISTYTMEQLQILIQEQRVNQEAAHKLAESARQLGWPEESEPIVSAKNEWWNAQLAIDAYHARYEELYAEFEMAKWNAKRSEYPAATEICLYMKDLGWNDYVCAGIMGNLMAEVGGQTLDIQYHLYQKIVDRLKI